VMGANQFVATVFLMVATTIFLVAEHVIPDPIIGNVFGISVTFSQFVAFFGMMSAYFALKYSK